jgi:hypothetical protein
MYRIWLIVLSWIANAFKIAKNLPALFRPESKTKLFFDIVKNTLDEKSLLLIVESTSSFILNGPVFQTFKEWESRIMNAFANRHVVEHGKYDSSLYTEENSINF